jgi:branched-chain amino acid aminotransferase
MIYMNSRLVSDKMAHVSVYDHGFLYGDGIYETLRVYSGNVFMLDQHVERLFRSATLIRLSIRKSPDMIKKAVYATLKANRHKDAVVRITVSRGAGPTGLDPKLCSQPTFVIFSKKFSGYPTRYYQKGISIAIVSTRRNFSRSLNPQIKSLNFLNNILAKIEAEDRGTFEAVMLNHRNFLAEGTVSNIFFVRDNALCTPSVKVGILDGITRGIVINLAKEADIEVKEGYFRLNDVYEAEEVFISNTTMEIMPVSKVDDTAIKGPGRITSLLQRAYRKKVSTYIKERISNEHK